MYNFVEQTVNVPSSEFPMLHRQPGRFVVQAGLQPVTFIQEDSVALFRPQSLLHTIFAFKKRG